MNKPPKTVKVTEDFFTEIPYRKYEEIIYAALQTPRDEDPRDPKCRMGAPIIIWGLSGTAKSKRVETLIKRSLGFPMETMYPVSYPAENFVGVPIILGNSVRSEVLIGPIRRLLRSGVKDAVLLIDEASDADSLTQSAMQPLILDRQAGDDQLPPGVRILVLANPPRYSAGGYELVAALANRLGHFYLPVNEDTMYAFLDYLTDPTPPKLLPFSRGVEAVKDLWQSEWSLYVSEVDAFLRSMGKDNVSLLHNQPLPGTPEAGGAWPSLRTWYTAMQCATTLRCLGMDRSLERLFFSAFIGKGPADLLSKFQVYRDLPTPREILEKKKGWSIKSTERVDRVSVMCAAVRTYVIAADTREEREGRATIAWEWFSMLCDAMFKDLVMKFGNALSERGLSDKSSNIGLRDMSREALRKLGSSAVTDH
jgi:hypothetical protein